jgi:dihydrodipicolinate synthase/N-acetylneuraminate lyase
MRGCCNVLMPTFTSDLARLNERAVRHDLRRCVELGFWGTLLVSECGTTLAEMKRFIEVAAEERDRVKPDFHLVLHGSFDTLENLLDVSRFAQDSGCDLLLLSYPLCFYPRTPAEIVDFAAAVSRGTDLGIILFAIDFWGFRRLHPSGFPPEALVEMAAIDTVVALKYECGHPGTGGRVQIQKLLGERLLVTDPIEFNSPAWVDAYRTPWIGTSYYEYFADRVPRYFALMHEGRWDEAMEVYWSIQPCREAYQAVRATIAGASLVPRPAWKYMGWLNGFNGGPVRMPHMRLNAPHMRILREGAERSGLDVTTDPDEAFFVGRNPE